MDDNDIKTVKDCWTKIQSANATEQLVKNFYQILFTKNPDMRSLFPENLQAQHVKFLFTLDNYINWIDSIDTLETELIDLGRSHKALEINHEKYDLFIQSLIESVSSLNDFSFTNNELSMLEKSLHKISNLMLKAYS